MEDASKPLKSSSLKFKQWTKLPAGGDVPSVRQGHAVAVVKEKAYLFGGSALTDSGESIFYNDFYSIAFTATDLSWERIEQNGDIPSAREGHSLVTVNDDIFLCGGIDTDSAVACVRELYVFNTETKIWAMKQPSGKVPQATSSTMVTTDDGHVVVFGGVFNRKACNDTYILNTESLVWALAETTGEPPKARCDHGCCVADKKMFVFGGSAGDSLWLNDLSYLCLDTMEWVLLGVIDSSPSPRDYLTLSNLSNKSVQQIILFGGFGDDTCNNDTFILSANKDISWKSISTDQDDMPLPPGRYGHASFTFGNQAFVHGGQDNHKMFEDLWMIEFQLPEIIISPTIPPRHNYKTESPVPVPRKTLNPPTPKPIELCDFDTLRSQYTGHINEIFDTLSKKFEELDSQRKMLEAEREQFEEERKNHHDTYDKQQKEVTAVLENHKKDNEEWVEKLRNENDEERRIISAEKAQLKKDREELEQEKTLFQEKSIKLDNIMKQVKGLTT